MAQDRRVSVLFDLDGTLTNPFVGITSSIRYALENMGYSSPADEELRRFIGPPLHVTFADFLKTDDEAVIWEAVGHYRERYNRIGKFENELIPGVKETLAACVDAGCFLSIATSKVEYYARDILEHFDLMRFFDAVYGSAPDGSHANKSDLIAHILKSERLEPRHALMIGDRLHDVEGAAANDVRAIGVLWGFGDRAELEEAGAARIVETPAELTASISEMLLLERN